ncbi:MAG: hypothetical protein ABIN67_18830 [Ferruginibacter sp.]
MIFVAGAVFSQKLPGKQAHLLLLQKSSYKLPDKNLFLSQPLFSPQIKEFIPPDFYVRQLPFFCKQEIKLEKATRIPFRFRVGTIEDCDRMEGKFKRN